MMTLPEFHHTRERIQPFIRNTPTVHTELPNVWLKLENLQYTHSFKARGAFARILDMMDRGDERTILTASAGNHGQGVARAASHFQRRCTVVVPESTPKAKIEAMRSYAIDLQ